MQVLAQEPFQEPFQEPLQEPLEIDLKELVKLCVTDSALFAKSFFPKAARAKPASFHYAMDDILDDPHARLVNFVITRGFAKTTKLRLFAAKRIAYGMAKTIVYVGTSEEDANRDVDWLRKAVERNPFFSQTFGLRKGSKWNETEVEIIHTKLDYPIRIISAGITSSLRGINFDDYRPDLIVLNDILTDENAATLEQREKIKKLVNSALKNSLAPQSEEPNAKMVMANTPQHIDDVCMAAVKDPEWVSLVHGCWTPETQDLPITHQESAWPEVYPSEVLRKEKSSAIAKNRLSDFLREKEVKLVSPETCSFRPEWLQLAPKLVNGHTVIVVDPVPPPSEREMAKGLKGKDFECVMAVSRAGGAYYALDYEVSKGHDYNWTVAKVIELAIKYRAVGVVVEAVAYQKTLATVLKTEMIRRKVYWPIFEFKDKRSKFTRIIGALGGLGPAQKLFYCNENMSELVEQFTNYGPMYADHDDVIDTFAIGVQHLTSPYLEGADLEIEAREIEVPKFNWRGGCP